MTSKRRFFLFLSFCVVATGLVESALAQEPNLEQLVRGSHIIFIGRVVRPRAVNLKVLQPTNSTALVRVEKLLDAPLAVAGLEGEEVTLLTQNPDSLRPSESAVFFTNGILFGEHLEAQEVGRMPVPSDPEALRKQITAVRAKIAEEGLQARIQSAVLIVTGKVLETKPLEQTLPYSEHQPDWAQAIVEITAAEKGAVETRTVVVYFPQSTDELWIQSPKFRAGQEGIWLLHHGETPRLPQEAFSALDPLDFHPLAKRETIRRLVR
jgi:hypothetical protein